MKNTLKISILALAVFSIKAFAQDKVYNLGQVNVGGQ